jgi:plasmid stabilization system protein ParE
MSTVTNPTTRWSAPADEAPQPQRDKSMSCFQVEVELTTYSDELLHQLIPEQEVRRTKVRGPVDSGASMIVLSERIATELGLPELAGQLAEVTLADGSTVTRKVAGALKLQYQDRYGLFDAVVEPGRQDIIIGALVLERLDLLVDCRREQFIPRKPGKLTFHARTADEQTHGGTPAQDRGDVRGAIADHGCERQRRGLGEGFLAAVRATLDRIQLNPELHAVVYREVRRELVRRFPDAVCYHIEAERIAVVAVHHGQRDPTRWHSRT